MVATLVALILGISPAFGQSTLGTIRGTVVDPQHQITPGATIVATDEATNVPRETTSDAEGNFELNTFRPLLISNYLHSALYEFDNTWTSETASSPGAAFDTSPKIPALDGCPSWTYDAP